MALSVSLEKSAQALTLSLEKKGVLTPPALEVGFALDVSGSFEDEHLDGSTTVLMQRLAPWGLAFDPDKKMDVFSFSNRKEGAHYVGAIDAKNHENYVRRNIVDKVPRWNCGTDYSFVIELMLEHFGWKEAAGAPAKTGFLSGLFGKKSASASAQPLAKKKSVVIIATDGDNFDKERTTEVLRASEARGDQVYFLFLGISNQGSTFPYLESIGDMFGNTGFLAVPNLKKFIALSDDELNEQLLNDELLEWLKK